MQIELLLFGIVKDIIGKSTMELKLSTNSTIADFKELLLKKYPKLSDYKSFSIAVNETYVDDDYLIQENDAVAIIPPVSGG